MMSGKGIFQSPRTLSAPFALQIFSTLVSSVFPKGSIRQRRNSMGSIPGYGRERADSLPSTRGMEFLRAVLLSMVKQMLLRTSRLGNFPLENWMVVVAKLKPLRIPWNASGTQPITQQLLLFRASAVYGVVYWCHVTSSVYTLASSCDHQKTTGHIKKF